MENSGMNRLDIQGNLRRIPSVDRLLESTPIKALMEIYPRAAVVESLRQGVERLRHRILNEEQVPDNDFTPDVLAQVTAGILESERLSTLRSAINATGVILHTGLGRSVLSRRAQQAVSEIAGSHSLLELNPEDGKRGSRQIHIEPLLQQLTGCESALAVNNNAAAVFLTINALAEGKEVIVSRGQLVEIGGSFRIPDIIQHAGARLVEVGTTNRTRLQDYADAITPETALLLYIHPSNFKIVGFTEEASVEELVSLGRDRDIPVMADLGSGALIDFSRFGLSHETTVQEILASGCDVVTCSGDKLIGGPQAGLILGKRMSLARIRTNPIARVVRIDKLSLAALEATLRDYLDCVASDEIPTLHAIEKPLSEIETQATELAEQLRKRGVIASVEEGESQVGGGSLPGEMLPTRLVMVQIKNLSADELARQLRLHRPAILTRIVKDRVSIDPRTLLPGEADVIFHILSQINNQLLS
jgi:L-seryl-tRNA(Ser) seleniumtransferase